jgi:hypothetical protein
MQKYRVHFILLFTTCLSIGGIIFLFHRLIPPIKKVLYQVHKVVQAADSVQSLRKLVGRVQAQGFFLVNYTTGMFDRQTLLHYASRYARSKCVMSLVVDFHAQVNLADDGGFTPLANAAYSGDLKSVTVLLEAGADPSVKCKAHASGPLTTTTFPSSTSASASAPASSSFSPSSSSQKGKAHASGPLTTMSAGFTSFSSFSSSFSSSSSPSSPSSFPKQHSSTSASSSLAATATRNRHNHHLPVPKDGLLPAQWARLKGHVRIAALLTAAVCTRQGERCQPSLEGDGNIPSSHIIHTKRRRSEQSGFSSQTLLNPQGAVTAPQGSNLLTLALAL